jgi:hypothetical protein
MLIWLATCSRPSGFQSNRPGISLREPPHNNEYHPRPIHRLTAMNSVWEGVFEDGPGVWVCVDDYCEQGRGEV